MQLRNRKFARTLFVVFAALAVIIGPAAAGASASAATSSGGEGAFTFWRGATLALGTGDGSTQLGTNNYRAGVTLRPGATSGVWTFPVVATNQTVDQINPSWQTTTPSGTHIETELRVRLTGQTQWSGWYQMGKWGFYNTPDFTRTSVNNQSDQFGTIWTDTYDTNGTDTVSAYQMRVRLVTTNAAHPYLYQLAATAFNVGQFSGQTSATTMTSTVDLRLTPYSQDLHAGEYVQYGGGGEAWCSPTSVVMGMSRWGVGPSVAQLATLPPDTVFDANGRKDAVVDYAAIHIYDDAYGGIGNWPFSVGYAAEFGLNTSVRQTSDLRRLEWYIQHGIPVVIPTIWDNTDSNPNNDLTGAGTPQSFGHLITIGGFTASGDVIAYDSDTGVPATPDADSKVRRVYDRTQFERDWLNANGGIFYVIGSPVS